MIDENLRAKIKKLFDMAKMGTGNEAEVAMRKALDLMQANGITQEDISLFIVNIPAPKRMGKWLAMLAQLCAEFSGVVSIFSIGLIKFGGDEIGVNIAKELFYYLKSEINRQLKNKNIKGEKERRDFRIGCIIGLLGKMEKFGGWRDMQKKRESIQKKYFSHIRIKPDRKTGVSRSYYENGKESSVDISIYRQAGTNANAGFLEADNG